MDIGPFCKYLHCIDLVGALLKTFKRNGNGDDIKLISSIAEMACAGGYLPTVELLHAKHFKFTRGCMDFAAREGHLHIIDFLFKNRKERCTNYALESASGSGHLAVVKYLCQNKLYLSIGSYAVDIGCQNGHFEVVKYLLENTSASFTSRGFDGACKGGHINIVRYLLNRNGVVCSNLAMDGASYGNHIDIVRELIGFKQSSITFKDQKLSFNITCSSFALDEAVRNRNIEMLKLLHSHQTTGSCSKLGFDYCTRNGDLEMLKFLLAHYESVAPSPNNLLVNACKSGNLEMVEFILEKFESHSFVISWVGAIKSGNLDIIKLLHTNNIYTCHPDVMDKAAHFNHLEIVKFLHYNRSEGCTVYAQNLAASNGNLEMLQFLNFNRTEGFTEDALNNSAKNNHFEVLKFLHTCIIDQNSNNISINTSETILSSCIGGHLEIIKYLFQHRTDTRYPITSRVFTNISLDKNHSSILLFLLDNIDLGYRIPAQTLERILKSKQPDKHHMFNLIFTRIHKQIGEALPEIIDMVMKIQQHFQPDKVTNGRKKASSSSSISQYTVTTGVTRGKRKTTEAFLEDKPTIEEINDDEFDNQSTTSSTS
eukprot:gene1485-1873_t